VRPGDEGNDAALDAVRDMAESDDSGLWATGFASMRQVGVCGM
jgi:hypothetical protein